MLSLIDIAERAQKGPRMDEGAWNMALFRHMQALTREYDIIAPQGDSWFNRDEALCDRLFEAALAYLWRVGVYCISTGRIVQFSEDEVRQAVRALPAQVAVGEGADRRVFVPGSREGRGPLFFRPGIHAPFREELAPLVVSNFAQISGADYLDGFNFRVVDGREVFGEPMEAYAAKREAAWLRDGIRKAGRPGMPVVYYPIGTRSAVLTAPIDPDHGLRATDGVLLSVLPDMKIEQDLLTAAIVYEEYGCFKVNIGAANEVGGFCGGFEGGMIAAVVRPLIGWLCYRDCISTVAVGRAGGAAPRRFAVSPRMAQLSSVACQTLRNHTNLIFWGGGTGGGGASGPGTETNLIAVGMGALGVPFNGGHLHVGRQTVAQMDSGITPLEAEWGLEVAQAVIRERLSRNRVEGIIERVAELLQGREIEPAQHISQCYDLVRHQPSAEYARLYQRVKEAFATRGLDFS